MVMTWFVVRSITRPTQYTGYRLCLLDTGQVTGVTYSGNVDTPLVNQLGTWL